MVGPPGFFQASRKVFNAIKTEVLASESVFNHNLARGPSPWGQECVVPLAPGMAAWIRAIQTWEQRQRAMLAFLEPKFVIIC